MKLPHGHSISIVPSQEMCTLFFFFFFYKHKAKVQESTSKLRKGEPIIQK